MPHSVSMSRIWSQQLDALSLLVWVHLHILLFRYPFNVSILIGPRRDSHRARRYYCPRWHLKDLLIFPTPSPAFFFTLWLSLQLCASSLVLSRTFVEESRNYERLYETIDNSDDICRVWTSTISGRGASSDCMKMDFKRRCIS